MKIRLYLIPGTLCNARLWSELTPYLAEYELVFIAVPAGSDTNQLIEQLAAALPPQPVALLGFSLGAYLASLLTLRYPDKIAKLMLVSNSPGPLSEDELVSRQHTLQLIEHFGYKGISQKKAEALLDVTRHSPATVQKLVRIIRQMDAELGKAVLTAQLRITSERLDLKDGLLALTQPIYFVYSEHDPLINKQWMQSFTRHNHAVIHTVAGSGHMLPLEQPLLLSQFINQWLGDV